MAEPYYHVETCYQNTWHFVAGSLGNNSYAFGFAHGIISRYPHPAVRVIKGNLNPEVVAEFPENKGVNKI